MVLFSKKQPSDVPRRRFQADGPSGRATEQELEQRYAFRRNRTITGSTSSSISSANEANADIKSPRVQAHELAKKRRHISGILLLVLACSLGLLVLLFQFTAQPTVRVAGDTSIAPSPVYGQAIQEYFGAQPIERLRFLLDEQKLTEFLQRKAPEVQMVDVRGAETPGTSTFVISMRTPIAGWNVNGEQRFVDASGVAFVRNYFTSPSVQVVDKSGIQVAAGQAIASNRFLGFVGRVVGLSKAQGYSVTQVIIPELTTRQVELRLKGVKYPVKLSVDRPAGEQIEDMIRAIQWMTAKNVKPKYIDVRVSGKAFYR